MDSVQARAAMEAQLALLWADIEAATSQNVSAASAMVVFQRLTKAMQSMVQAGFVAWLQAGDCRDKDLIRDGRTFHFKMVSAKQFETPLGTITVPRRLFQDNACQSSVVPLDEKWGMAGQSATPEVREAAVYLLGLIPPAEAQAVLDKTALFSVGPTTMRKWAAAIGRWLEEHPEVVADVRQAELIPPETKVVCASLDGSNVRLAERGPKPGRPATGDDRGLAPTCFKNAKVGTVSLYGAVPAKATTPQRLRTSYVSHMPEADSLTFYRKFEAEVADIIARSGLHVTKVLVLDTATALWDYVCRTPLFAAFEKIIDYFHVCEHLSAAGDALFGKGTARARKWMARHKGTLLDHDDGGQRIVRAIDRHARLRQLSPAARAELTTQRNYFANHGHRMTYASFRARGLPIGSGPVEAAGKSLIKVRLGRGGMRWSRPGGQHILAIRTIIKSDRWDEVWRHYLQLANAA